MCLNVLTQTPNIVFRPFYTECLSGMHNIVYKKIMEKHTNVSEGQWKRLRWKVEVKKSVFLSLNSPYSRRCDDSNEENPATAEWVRRLEDEDVLEEERV